MAISLARSVSADGVAAVLPPDGLNLRAGPATTHATIAVIPGGTRIAITGDAADGWYPAMYRNQKGWVRAEFVDVPSDTRTITRRAAVRTTAGVVLRDEPSPTARTESTAPAGATLTVSARATSDNWVMAAYQGATGWVLVDALQFEGQPPPPATTTPATAGIAAGPNAVRGRITYYHPSLEGGPMYCGGRYRAADETIAAATSWPCGTKLRVCYKDNCIVVTVQDTGHMGPNWVDLSSAAFQKLAPLPEANLQGTIEVVRD